MSKFGGPDVHSPFRGGVVGGPIPPHPAVVVKTAQTPPPPQLDPSQPPLQQVHAILRAYRAAVGKFVPSDKRSRFLYSRGLSEKSRGYNTFVRAAEVLAELYIPPHHWTAFAVHMWIDIGKRGAPPPTWAFSVPMIRRNAEWCREHSQLLTAPRDLVPASYKQLHADWERMQQELLRLQPRSLLVVEAIVDHFFPGDSYNERAKQATQDSIALLAQYEKELSEDGWPW